MKINVLDRPCTKRDMLSVLHSIYGPLGFAAPVMILPKLWLREVKDLDWDEVFCADEQNRWSKWINSLQELKTSTIRRCIKPSLTEIESFVLHHFADGSSMAYGAVSYIRVVDLDGQA